MKSIKNKVSLFTNKIVTRRQEQYGFIENKDLLYHLSELIRIKHGIINEINKTQSGF